eukprot:scaffold87775_cov48-Phaeocystis_antarctica.AAC.1
MTDMSMTLEVSKLSGWLNADAPCREPKEGIRCGTTCGPGGREAAGDRGARSVQWRLDCRLGAGHGEGRTRSIWYMLVTLEVSKLSGWLNADAACRESNRGHAVQGEVRLGRAAGGGRSRCT